MEQALITKEEREGKVPNDYNRVSYYPTRKQSSPFSFVAVGGAEQAIANIR